MKERENETCNQNKRTVQERCCRCVWKNNQVKILKRSRNEKLIVETMNGVHRKAVSIYIVLSVIFLFIHFMPCICVSLFVHAFVIAAVVVERVTHPIPHEKRKKIETNR